MKKVFFTCGPSQLYPTVPKHLRDGLEQQIFSISHRSSQFMELYGTAVTGLRRLMSIPKDYEVFFISSGTEGMERVIQNCVEKVSGHIVDGSFSRRWQTVSEQLGKKTESLTVSEGHVPDFKKARFSKQVELICVTQNETSTGVMITSQAITKLHKKYPQVLIAVDMVSCAPTVALDIASTDCVIFSVQKAFGLPAGLGVVIASPRAMKKSMALTKKASTGTYHSFTELKKYADKQQTPDTPNVLDIYLLSKIVGDLNKIGIKKLRAQTQERAEKIYDLITNHPAYSPFVKEKSARSTTTIVVGVVGGSARVIEALKKQGIVVSSGYKDFKEKQIRIGNFPAHNEHDFKKLCAALKLKSG